MSQSLCWGFSRLMRNVSVAMSDRWSWITLCSKCERIYTKYGDGVRIPNDNPKDENPLDVFDDSNVEENVMRFVVYILWLKQQPHSFENYLDRSSIVPSSDIFPCNPLW